MVPTLGGGTYLGRGGYLPWPRGGGGNLAWMGGVAGGCLSWPGGTYPGWGVPILEGGGTYPGQGGG